MRVRREIVIVAFGLVGTWAAGCTETGEPDAALLREAEADALSPALVQADSCDAVMAGLKARLAADMEAQLAANLERALSPQDHGCVLAAYDAVSDTGGSPGAAERPEGASASEFSETNVQVEGVDEADFVKNDGGHIYVLAADRFQVLDAWPAQEAHRVSSFPIEGAARRMYVHADTAVIYSSLGALGGATPQAGVPADGTCTYGYDCEFTGDGRELKITVLDIADRAQPRLVREVYFNGAYLNSRRIGLAVHTAIVSPELTVEGLRYWPQEVPDVSMTCGGEEPAGPVLTAAEVKSRFEALRLTNLALIEGASATALLPSVRDTWHLGGVPYTSERLLTACDALHVSPTGEGRSFVSLVSFAVDKSAPLAGVSILSRPGAVYASTDSLYLAVRHRAAELDAWFGALGAAVDEATTVHKFALEPGGARAEYAASGVIEGRLLNQFAMDEHDGALRIATTSGRLPDPNVHSAVSVLIEQGSRLKQIGRVDDLAPGEDIRSVRFAGEVGFVVTFKKTDPLFVLDLGDPRAPRVRGELKIPGFSTYMHRLDDAHLLTIGYDADEAGDFAWFQGVQLQVIDVSDLSDPELVAKEVIGTRGSTSEAATNHLAFTYFKARDVLAVPMTVCEGGGGGEYGDLMTFSGLLVYRVTAEDGFTLLGGVPHREPETPQSYSGACNNWWTNANSIVKRSVFMEDWVYSIAPEQVKVAHLDDLAHPAASISLTQP